VGVAVVNKVSQGEPRLFLIVIGIMAVVFALILPITAIMYMDILAMRAVVKEELIKVIKARKELEKDRQITKEE
jgi:hypothetical protein